MDITGKIALITGGASGIGAATCEAFAKAGGHVIVADINVEGGEKIAKSIVESGGKAQFLKLDVTNEASIERPHPVSKKSMASSISLSARPAGTSSSLS